VRRGLFVVGTDTGVGKTLVVGALAAALVNRGKWPGVLKPVESGCSVRDGKLVPLDALFLRRCAGRLEPESKIALYCFDEPVAPGVAAAHAGVKVDDEKILHALEDMSNTSDSVIVEGAGGLMVPYSDTKLLPSLIGRLALPVLVVAANRLGAVNHTLLTLKALDDLGLRTVGVLLNNLSGVITPAMATNKSVIDAYYGREVVLGSLPFREELGGDKNQIPVGTLTSWLEEAFDLEEFLYLTDLIK
jgi:dethiobiotin synthetase